MSVSEFNTLRDHAQRLADEAAVAFRDEIARLERRIAAMEAGKSRITHPRDLAAFASLEERIGILEAKKPAKG